MLIRNEIEFPQKRKRNSPSRPRSRIWMRTWNEHRKSRKVDQNYDKWKEMKGIVRICNTFGRENGVREMKMRLDWSLRMGVNGGSERERERGLWEKRGRREGNFKSKQKQPRGHFLITSIYCPFSLSHYYFLIFILYLFFFKKKNLINLMIID